MLNKLRWQLTFTYIIATLALVILVGGGSYYVLQTYLWHELDLALKHGMAGQFILYGLEIPPSLEEAEQEWRSQQTDLISSSPGSTSLITGLQYENNDNEDDDEYETEYGESGGEEILEHGYGSQLISIFTMPLDASGAVIFNPNPYSLPMDPDQNAFQAAMQVGWDFRTVELSEGQRVRLLTYRTGAANDPAAFQLGRITIEQDRALRQLLVGVLVIGGLSLVLVGLGSWQLAGASLLPAQKGLDQQQAFVANASHELRTPLTLIRASTEMAQRKNTDPEISPLLGNVIEEADYMNHLVNDLLLLSRLDAKQLKLDRQSFNVAELIEEVSDQLKQLAGSKNLQILTRTVDQEITADINRIRQVLLIIGDNAVKHTPPGGTIQLVASEINGKIQLVVKDNGTGIAAEHLPHIFERFYQVQTSAQDDQRSNGLGLSIAKQLVELHGGPIKITSALNQGTTITISLPAS